MTKTTETPCQFPVGLVRMYFSHVSLSLVSMALVCGYSLEGRGRKQVCLNEAHTKVDWQDLVFCLRSWYKLALEICGGFFV